MFSPEEELPKNMDLSILGSSIPIYSPQPKTTREYKSSRPQVQRRKKEFSFPVEKIVYLTERLELTSLTETKSLSVSSVDVQRNKTTATPTFDFSIDLSSISNDDDDDDDSDDGSLHYSSCKSPNEIPELESLSSTEKPKPRTGDLINVYMNSSNNQEIAKYFRPCRSCEEVCCVCPATPRETHKEPQCCCQIDYVPPCCGCCLSDDSVPSSRSGVVSYTSSLANAARSARVLARDLEVILSSLNTGN